MKTEGMGAVININFLVEIQYNTIQFRLMAQKNTPVDTDATEDYTKRKLNNTAYWTRQGDEYFLSYFMI